MESRPWPSGVT